jgi:anti-sigma regulatory factor (Ser/Thr protein kinase)
MPTPMSQPFRSTPPAGWPRRALRLTIAGGPRAPERARAWLKSAAAWLPEELERSLLLLTCELVNNSVVHGHAGEEDVIDIELRSTAGGVRAQVSDSGPGFAPGGRDRPMDEPGGWGLVLVDRMASRWGVEHDGGTSVWFELGRA